MALQFTYKTKMGFIADEAYAHISSYRGNKLNISIDIMVFNNRDAKDNSLTPIDFINYELYLLDGATMQQMYDALKLLPEFTGAIDV